MNQSLALMEALKRRMREQGVRYADVAEHLDVSESSIKRLFAKGDISLTRLEKICELLDVTVLDLARTAEQPVSAKPRELTVAQENFLVEQPVALNYFYKLLQGWTPERMESEFGLKSNQTVKVLNALQDAKLIAREPGLKVKLLVDNRVTWRRRGPLWKHYKNTIQRLFLNDPFDHKEAVLQFDAAELSLEARGVLAQKITAFERDFAALADMSLEVPEEQRESVGVLLATRPWRFRQIDELDPTVAFQSL